MAVSSIALFFFVTIAQSYATTALLAAATNNCSYALYSRAKTFTYRVTSEAGDSRNCEWRLTVAQNEKILLNLTDIFIVKSLNCDQGYVEVRDGYWTSSPLLGRYCGGRESPRMLYKTVLSTSNKLLISYSNFQAGVDQGFVASYEGICGGSLFVENSTTFSSPNYPSLYPLDRKCIWRVVVPDNETVALYFNSFSVEYQSNCLYDYVEVIDGSVNGTVIGRYCNANYPPSVVISNSSEIFVKFVSDSSLALSGFEAVVRRDYDECANNMHDCAQLCVNTIGGYQCACSPGFELHSNGRWCEVACGGTLTSFIGNIQSPSYPYNYPSNRSCVWNITAFYESRVKLNFEFFSLEIGVSNGTAVQCNKDWLKVSNIDRSDPWTTSSSSCRSVSNSNEVATLQGTYCGSNRPDPITSEGNELSISFNSDATIERGGFLINYSTELEGCLINNGNCHHACVNTSGSSNCVCNSNYTLEDNGRDCSNGNCLFEISSPNGTITSPNYPNNYPANKNCAWKFRTTPGHRLNITFQSFLLENHTTCIYDYVVLYDGPSTTNTSLGKFCGGVIPSQINSSTNDLYMAFRSDSSTAFSGFKATYSTVCGGNLTADTTEKYIYSHPNFGYEDYKNGLFCEWKIQAPQGKKVTVSFLSFLLESGSCSYDYVEILNQSGTALINMGRWCWHNKPPRICSTNSALVIRFRTDGSVTSSGFSMVYKATD